MIDMSKIIVFIFIIKSDIFPIEEWLILLLLFPLGVLLIKMGLDMVDIVG